MIARASWFVINRTPQEPQYRAHTIRAFESDNLPQLYTAPSYNTNPSYKKKSIFL